MSNFFTDTIKNDPRFKSRNRIADPMLLEPNLRRKVLAIISDAAGHGSKLMIFETYRSADRQLQLFHEGATELRQVGVHHYGLACDMVFNVLGEPSWKGDFKLLAHLAKAHQLISGSDWGHPEKPHSFRDLDHVQWCRIEDQKGLFDGSWYPSNSYDPTRRIG